MIRNNSSISGLIHSFIHYLYFIKVPWAACSLACMSY
uniref:Uncharacterized protein n=1 Tax=Anguilla anguilla TaxID=7936 RepID=A0A0E9VEP7_ANGAN